MTPPRLVVAYGAQSASKRSAKRPTGSPATHGRLASANTTFLAHLVAGSLGVMRARFLPVSGCVIRVGGHEGTPLASAAAVLAVQPEQHAVTAARWRRAGQSSLKREPEGNASRASSRFGTPDGVSGVLSRAAYGHTATRAKYASLELVEAAESRSNQPRPTNGVPGVGRRCLASSVEARCHGD